ncbi:hypothetical protein EJ03DRAFT_20540 [Teratosphaeria nubilosa]|uniref:Uncharacterized protein n=1 Tax=Teratosphaeria nubilosa TaxID=161662 RepID=A0A6G1LFK1_9PEZI|nr:hypothetical protein EJ03DRAFT_20540 [Teratosphaeria nubilosa]
MAPMLSRSQNPWPHFNRPPAEAPRSTLELCFAQDILAGPLPAWIGGRDLSRNFTTETRVEIKSPAHCGDPWSVRTFANMVAARIPRGLLLAKISEHPTQFLSHLRSSPAQISYKLNSKIKQNESHLGATHARSCDCRHVTYISGGQHEMVQLTHHRGDYRIQCASRGWSWSLEPSGKLTAGWTNNSCKKIGGTLSGDGNNRCCTTTKWEDFDKACNKQRHGLTYTPTRRPC